MGSQLTVAVVAEKPSVARDIARVLQATQRGEGYLHGNGYVVTWAIGHLAGLAQPHEIRPEWKSWRRDLLPMIPEQWPLVVTEQTRDQFEVVQKILRSPKVDHVVCATDAGREGELIFRYIYEAAGCDKRVRRLWISSLTPEAIRDGFAKLKEASEYDPLADAARGRSRADWLVGLNLSRAYTIAYDDDLSVGRVQTPTLAMVVERELAIRNFVPEDYFQVIARFGAGPKAEYQGTWFRKGVEPLEAAMRLPVEGGEAEVIAKRVQTGQAEIESVEGQTKRMAPPLLYDLTELQRHANRLYGMSAQRTLETAQALYEKHKAISYPRTDSRHLSEDVAKTLPKIVRAIAGGYETLLAPGTGERALGKRFVDGSKVSDHHAIIPTGVGGDDLEGDEQRIYDLICRRLLQAWHDDHIVAVTTVITLVRSEGAEDRFHSSGTAVVQAGWKVLDIQTRRRDEGDDAEQELPPGLRARQRVEVLEAEAVRKRTRPPKRLTEATLLTAMETAGKTLDDKELSDAMKESGLGTPATRAQIIEVLLKRGFIERKGKSLEATDKGIRLIEIVHPEVKSPAMTGQWEAYLKRIERGQAALDGFLRGIEEYVRQVIGKVGSGKPANEVVVRNVAIAERKETPQGDLETVMRERFRYAGFRPIQEEVCKTVIGKRDVLLVMPTGSGKSLCYQLPGIMLGGTSVVISPLIALMEDQVAKLNAMGFAADRIHSNRDRNASRDACFRYLEGKLDFLFIAPERMRVRGFPEMLAKRKPVLVAIDEAHCISQWGHDFRPDYRTLDQYLPALRPAPVIALTATATPLVQGDIARQLGLEEPRHFIQGFRRENIAIEVVKVAPSARFRLAESILADEKNRPAIVYTPRRRDAEELAQELSREHRSAAYHAGLDGKRREQVQREFLEGRLDVIVATIAFGMGVDKPDVRTVIHTALPGSVEGYYQEIGRAGRDGKPSRAILMHSYADRFTHDFFFERDYPEPKVLAGVYERLNNQPQPQDLIASRSAMGRDQFATALEKLWIHGGAAIDENEDVLRGNPSWRGSYEAQRAHKVAQFEKMLTYCEAPGCRMSQLVNYFGDRADSGKPCGTCDFCAPGATVASTQRTLTKRELHDVERMLDWLRKNDGISTGKLHQLAFSDGSLDRRGCEELIAAMARSGVVTTSEASFEKNGEVIEYRKVFLTLAGRDVDAAETVMITDDPAPEKPKVRKKKSGGRKAKKKEEPVAAEGPKAKKTARGKAAAAPAVNIDTITAALKAWRLTEARKRGVPAFRILTDRAVEAIAAKQPQTTSELLQAPGVGLKVAEQYGAQIFRILSKTRG